jgi:hypothetical protein
MKELTKSELQYLIYRVKNLIKSSENWKDVYSTNANFLWEKCDKNNNPGSDEYQALKYHLTQKDKYTKQQKKLAVIQGKLKKLASD